MHVSTYQCRIEHVFFTPSISLNSFRLRFYIVLFISSRRKKNRNNFVVSNFIPKTDLPSRTEAENKLKTVDSSIQQQGRLLVRFTHIQSFSLSCFIRILPMVCIEVYELHVCINTQHLQHFIRIMFVVGMIDLYSCIWERNMDRNITKSKMKIQSIPSS